MKTIKVAAATLNQVPLDWQGNQARILSAVKQAAAEKVSILCLPELCLTGYGCEDAFHSPHTIRKAWQALQALLPATEGMIVSFGRPVLHQNALFNTAGLVVNGKIVGFVAKRFLAGDGIHYEPRWFKPWPPGLRSSVLVEGQSYPIGDLYFDCGVVRIGFEICEDAWVASRPGAALALKGVDVILNPSSSYFAFGKLEVRKRFVIPPEIPVPTSEAWEESRHLKEEEFTRAEALALLDYLRKSHSYGFVISLSGGADSSALGCLVHLMVALGLQQLGPEDLKEKLAYIPSLDVTADAKSLTGQLRNTAYQSTRNSGSVTRNAARGISQAIGARHYEWDVDELVQRYVETLGHVLGQTLNWQEHDLALQNIQARVRAPGIWLLANLRNALLLATSNRSETAVGYATMDGDTCGGLSPLAGIDKAWLRQWLRWLETTGPVGLFPIPALRVVNQQTPTAELRPPENK